MARLALQDSNKRIIETLEVNSEVLDNIHDEFNTIVIEDNLQIYSFQEAQGVSGIKGLHSKVGYYIFALSRFVLIGNAVGGRRLLFETRSPAITGESREHRCKPHADGEVQRQ